MNGNRHNIMCSYYFLWYISNTCMMQIASYRFSDDVDGFTSIMYLQFISIR